MVCRTLVWPGPDFWCVPWVQVHVGWLPGGTAILAFRGTESAQDGLQDVKIIRKNVDYMQEVFPGVQAHTGDQNVHLQVLKAYSSLERGPHATSGPKRAGAHR